MKRLFQSLYFVSAAVRQMAGLAEAGAEGARVGLGRLQSGFFISSNITAGNCLRRPRPPQRGAAAALMKAR